MTKFISIDKDTQEKKETVFTHCLNGACGWVYEPDDEPSNYNKIIYLGKCPTNGDMFACEKGLYILIFKGTKGDEFN